MCMRKRMCVCVCVCVCAVKNEIIHICAKFFKFEILTFKKVFFQPKLTYEERKMKATT